MTLDPIEFASGHKCIDNDLNDYDLLCPTHGSVGFLPYMIARTLTAEHVCPACSLPLGDITLAPREFKPKWIHFINGDGYPFARRVSDGFTISTYETGGIVPDDVPDL